MNRAHASILIAALFCIFTGCDDSQTPTPPGGGTGAASAGGDGDPKALAVPHGWVNWRGPHQTGVSDEKGLVSTWQPDGENHLWTYDLPGRGTPVIAGDRAYAWGYVGETDDLQEVIVCLDVKTGEKIWERRFNDFISDIIYNRYSIGSPTVDPETGNLYVMTTPGLMMCLDSDGKTVWEHSMMERFGRLTFPNGRTGAPVVDGELVITRGITSYWGKQGPARDRFFAFDKLTGDLVWVSTPGVGPPYLKDSCFSQPVIAMRKGKRVLYSGTGCGNVVCINARTGQPIWRFQLAVGGVNSAVVPHKDGVIAVHGRENIDQSTVGRTVKLKTDADPGPGDAGPVVLEHDAEVWRNNDVGIFTSSPVLVGDRVYQCTLTGDLYCIDADTGKSLWHKKLAPSQLHASPMYADGKLYVPMQNGQFYILKPTDEGCEELLKVQLDGSCFGAPSVYNGRILIHTTKKLYCFGKPTEANLASSLDVPRNPPAGKAASLLAVPSDVLMRPGQKATFRLSAIDAAGFAAGAVSTATWEKFIPPTAKVKVKLDGEVNKDGELEIQSDASTSAGMFKGEADGLVGFFRGRVLEDPPLKVDFEDYELTVDHPTDGVKFAYPPLPWIGARLKWEVRDVGGNKALAKTLDRILFQRSTVFFGHPDEKNYTLQADVMSDGNRRVMSTVGLVNQRYIIALLGNHQAIEVSSNHERLKVRVPFRWKPDQWITLKTRVDVKEDGSGVVRAKAWPKGEAEPDAWTIEVPHKVAHTHGAPGLFGFSPQSQKRVFIDNIELTPNN